MQVRTRVGRVDVATVEDGASDVRIAWNESSLPPPSVTQVTPAVLPSLVHAGEVLVVVGVGLDQVTGGFLGGVDLEFGFACSPADTQTCVLVQEPGRLEIVPPPLSPGAADLVLEYPAGSVTVGIPVAASTQPVLNPFDLDSAIASGDSLFLYHGGPPGSLSWLLFSTSLAGTSVPGIPELEIGNRLTELFTLTVEAISSDGWNVFVAGIPPSAVGLTLGFQSAALVTPGFGLPLATNAPLALRFL